MYNLSDKQHGLLIEEAETAGSPLGGPDYGTPTTTLTLPGTTRLHLHATTRKTYRLLCTYGGISPQP